MSSVGKPGVKPGGRRISVGLLALAFAGTILMAEVSARLAGFGDPPLVVLDKEVEYYLVPGRSYRRFGQNIHINSLGMRSPEVDFSRTDRAQLFALFGDSIVFGHGLDQSDTVPTRLQERLRRQSGVPAAVVSSIAASSWGPENLLAFYRGFGPFRGNVAWVVQSTHDMLDVMHQPNDPPPYKSQSTFLALQDIGMSVWLQVWTRLGLGGNGGQTYEAKRERSDRALAQLINTLKADYSRVFLVFHANRSESAREVTAGEGHFEKMARAHGIEFLSTVEPYRQATVAGQKPHFDDIHLGPQGAELLASLLLQGLASASGQSRGVKQ